MTAPNLRPYQREGYSWLVFLHEMAAGGILAPIAEELYFRGYVFRSYLQTRSPWVAYGATSLLFATLHLNLPALLPILSVALRSVRGPEWRAGLAGVVQVPLGLVVGHAHDREGLGIEGPALQVVRHVRHRTSPRTL